MKKLFILLFGKMLRYRTRNMILFDILRLKARGFFEKQNVTPKSEKLHLACGGRRVEGWLNSDVSGSEYNVDLGCGRLPWKDNVFETVVCQHVIDDLDIDRELIPLLIELKRVVKTGGQIWLSCPDLEKICKGYIEDRFVSLVADRKTRIPGYSLGDYPNIQFFNHQVFEAGNNCNMFDFELLSFVLRKAGLKNVSRVTEKELLETHPDFPPRNDELHALNVKAVVED